MDEAEKHIPFHAQKHLRAIDAGKGMCTQADVQKLIDWMDRHDIAHSFTSWELFFVIHEYADVETLRWLCTDVILQYKNIITVTLLYTAISTRVSLNATTSKAGSARREPTETIGADQSTEPDKPTEPRNFGGEYDSAGRRVSRLGDRVQAEELSGGSEGPGQDAVAEETEPKTN